MEKPPSKILVPETSKTQNITTPVPNYAIPSKGDTSSRVIYRKIIQDVSKEIPIYPDPVYRPPPKIVQTPILKIHRSLLHIDPELYTNFEDNLLFQEVIISETYQRPDKSYFQEPQELQGLINTSRLVQKFFLPKQADIDKILNIIQWKVLRGTH